jgi:hypothetical protein
MRSPRFLLALGVILLILGWVFPFLMVLKILPSTFFLNFLSWGASVSGLFLGMIGMAMGVKWNR